MRGATKAKRLEKAESQAMASEEQQLALQVAKAQKLELAQQSIKGSFKAAEATVADNAIAKFFYANGITFGAARDAGAGSYYYEMVRAIQAAPKNYVPPNARALAGPLIDVCHGQMLTEVAKRDEGGVISDKFGSTYTSDGCDSCDHLPLINSYQQCSHHGERRWRLCALGGHQRPDQERRVLRIAHYHLTFTRSAARRSSWW